MYTKVRPRYCAPEYNPRLMEYATYKNNITDPASQLEHEGSYSVERDLVHISSQFRDRTHYPDPGFFRVDLPGGFQDVVAVELVGGTLPNIPGLTNNPYILLDMGGELNQVRTLDGNTYFAVLNFFHHISGGAYLTLDRSTTEGKPATFQPLKSRLNNLQFRFLYPDGTQVMFGSEDPNEPMDFQRQVSLTFQIHTRSRRRMGIERDARTIPQMN